MASPADSFPLCDTQACKMAGDAQGFLREVMAQVRTELLRIHAENPRSEPMSDDEVKAEIEQVIRDVLEQCLDEDITALQQRVNEEYRGCKYSKHYDLTAAMDEVRSIVKGWCDEFVQLFHDETKRRMALKDAQES